MKVFVKNIKNEPLMPCSERKARILLKNNRAKIIGYKPFTIQLLQWSGNCTQECNIGIDTGSLHVGIAITSENKVLCKGTVELRDDIHKNMIVKGSLRSNRRYRNTRYRKARFLNRKIEYGWLPPTIKSKYNATCRWIDAFNELVPNPKLHIEIAKFNMAKIKTGQLENNVKAFVLARDKYTCQCCKSKNKKLHVHHLVYKSKGGTNTPNNLISVCIDCHTPINHEFGGRLYDWMIKNKKTNNYKENGHMNYLQKLYQGRYQKARFTYGYEAKAKRNELMLPKEHYNDSIAISNINTIKRMCEERFVIRQFRKKKRSLHESIPRKGRTTKNTLCGRFNKNVPYRQGYFMNDEVLYRGKRYWIYGFAGGDKGRQVVLRDINGDIVRSDSGAPQIHNSNIKLIRHNNNWQFKQCDRN